jgi:hypothetical protein
MHMNARRAIFALLLWVAAAAPSLAIIYTTLDFPGGSGTEAEGISGGEIVGSYTNSKSVTLGFFYDGSTWTTLDDPLAKDPYRTIAFGISGNSIVGTYYPTGFVGSAGRGLLYNGTTYTTLDDPMGTEETIADGIDGNNIVGFYTDSARNNHGFLYDGATYTTLDDPLAAGPFGTEANGISGNNIVGQYTDASGNYHGFLATVPEPSTFALAVLGFGGLIFRSGQMHRRSDARIGRQRNRGRSFRA